MEKRKKKDIHILGVEDGYELGQLLPQGGLASRIVIARFLKEKMKAYKLGLMKGIEQRKELSIQGRQALLSEVKLKEKSLIDFTVDYGMDQEPEF